MSQPVSFYEAVGGEETFRRLVHRFYQRVPDDPVLRPVYPAKDLGPAEEHLRLFLMQYWGGPRTYDELRGHPRLRMRHARFAIGEAERDAWLRHMRAALDETSRELGRYVRLTNYASGLCMPEIAALAGLERLDMMLNDCMYGIIFRDINPVRTFIDQRFSRQVHARAGIVINTGEDNYLTTADAVDAAHTVVVSQLLNEYFGREAGLADAQLGLGHAFEINPELPDSFLLELAHAQLIRELFPDAPLKYMPPTKHMTGNVFAGYLLDAFFNLCGVMTDQSILLIGMMTEGIHTPFLSDRDLALENVRYVRRAAGRLGQEFRPEPDGFVAQRARQVLGESVDLLRTIGSQGLLNAIAEGTFGVTKRPADGGRGLDGVVERDAGYYNPASEILEAAQ